ncbi:MAG TPA: rhomboid family intramembrane serine protease [Pirellulaceae bacterium]|nr:rhomboid family intramembrane serine protease [Pirellulaceae bacterium]
MRQLAIFESHEQARRLAAYLVTQRIAAHAEQENGGYGVWVRDEDQMPSAREALAHFRENPDDPRYDGVESTAIALKRKQEAERDARQKNVVEMRGRWGSGAGIRRKCPLTIGLIAISIFVAVATNLGDFGPQGPQGLLNQLLVVDSDSLTQSYQTGQPDYFASIRRGQVWRLMTPIFVHFSITHVVFNMWWMFSIGGQVEDRNGSRYFAGLVLVLAITSVTASALVNQWQRDLALAGGMSGVGYGVFGYLWMKVKFDPAGGYQLDRLTVVIGMAWFVLCILRDYAPFDQLLAGLIPGRVDNTAHLVGLVVGMAAGYAPLLIKRR